MAASQFKIKQGDTTGELGDSAGLTLKDGDGNAVDVTGATIKFTMWNPRTKIVKIKKATATIVTASTGKVKYTWVAGDTDTPGTFEGEFEVTYSGGGIQTFPNNNADKLTILIDEQGA